MVIICGNVRSYLIREHQIDGLFLQESAPCARVHTVVQQDRDDLRILGGFGETASAALVEGSVDFFLRAYVQGTAVQMTVGPQREGSIRRTAVHPRKVGLHVVGREHGDVLEAEWLEDVLLKVVVEPQPGGSFDQLARPVDVDAILPCFARLIDQGLGEIIVERAREFVEPPCPSPVVEALVEERVSEPSCNCSCYRRALLF